MVSYKVKRDFTRVVGLGPARFFKGDVFTQEGRKLQDKDIESLLRIGLVEVVKAEKAEKPENSDSENQEKSEGKNSGGGSGGSGGVDENLDDESQEDL